MRLEIRSSLQDDVRRELREIEDQKFRTFKTKWDQQIKRRNDKEKGEKSRNP